MKPSGCPAPGGHPISPSPGSSRAITPRVTCTSHTLRHPSNLPECHLSLSPCTPGQHLPASLRAPRASMTPSSRWTVYPFKGPAPACPYLAGGAEGTWAMREAGVWEALSGTGWPPWPWEDSPSCPSRTPCRLPHSGPGGCVCKPTSGSHPGLMETSEPGGPGEEPEPCVYLSLRFSMKSSMVTWSKSTKSGLPHSRPSSSILPAGGTQARLLWPSCAEGRRGGCSEQAQPFWPPPQPCGKVGSGFWPQGGAALPTCCSLPRGSDPGFLVSAPRRQARLTVEVLGALEPSC